MALTRKDPFGGYNYAVELDGITRMGFKSVAGLDTTTGVTKYREGTDPTLEQRALPGLLSNTNITLTRGITDDRALWDWRESVMKGEVVRRDISIILRDDKGEVMASVMTTPRRRPRRIRCAWRTPFQSTHTIVRGKGAGGQYRRFLRMPNIRRTETGPRIVVEGRSTGGGRPARPPRRHSREPTGDGAAIGCSSPPTDSPATMRGWRWARGGDRRGDGQT